MTRHITRITAIALVTLALLPAAAPRSDSKPGMPEVPGTPAASLGPSPSGIDASVTPASGNAAWSRSGAPETLEWKPSEENPGGSDAAGDDPIASSSAGGSGPPSGAPPTTAPTSTTAGSRAPRSPARVVTGARPAAGPKAVAIHATWYCKPPRYPRCTIGYPAGSFVAAISPDLRAWTGRMVRVRFGSAHVDVRIVDCDCQAEHAIDLYAVAFAKLAPTSVGELTVTLELLNG